MYSMFNSWSVKGDWMSCWTNT